MKTETANIKDYLKPVTFNDFDIINSFLKKYPSEYCDFNICNIFSWDLFLKFEYAIYSDRLILFNPFDHYFFAPVGEPLSARDLFQINNFINKNCKEAEILGVSIDYINNNPDLEEYFCINDDKSLNDYIYTTESLVKLPGKKLAKKKNLVSQFMSMYTDFSVNSIAANDYTEIMEFCYQWRNGIKFESDIIDIEFEAIRIILTHWDFFPCAGLKLYANGKICAFSIYSPQTKDMATIHFEKCDSKIKGAGQVINQETAKKLIMDFKYINREQDMGMEGIRQAKRSYNPVRILPYYRLKSR